MTARQSRGNVLILVSIIVWSRTQKKNPDRNGMQLVTTMVHPGACANDAAAQATNAIATASDRTEN